MKAERALIATDPATWPPIMNSLILHILRVAADKKFGIQANLNKPYTIVDAIVFSFDPNSFYPQFLTQQFRAWHNSAPSCYPYCSLPI